jgi:hypothetical protein
MTQFSARWLGGIAPIVPDVLIPGTVLVTLANGKIGKFMSTIPGSFRGESDFGQAEVSARSVVKMVMQ